MTISTLIRTNQYNGNNSTTAFAYVFNIQADSEIEVYLGTPVGAPTTWTKKTLTTHYTVSNAGVAGVGNVTFGSAPPTGVGNVFIRRVTPKTQASDYVENDPFPANTQENALDKLTQITQDMQEEIDRCFKLGSIVPDAGDTEASSVVADRKNKLFAFDSSGDFSVTSEIGTSQGTWAASTAYVVRDIVKDTSASPQAIYICLTAHTSSGSLPISTNTDSAKWRLLIEDGAVGATGAAAGLDMTFESTTTDTDQGAGKVWLNHGTASSATVLYMDDVDANSVNINSFVDSWDDSTTTALRGTIMVKKATAPENYHIFNVTGAVTSASTYSKIAVTHVVSAGTISDTHDVHVEFVRTGDTGATGARGSDAGLDMTFESTTTDTDQGVGKVWFNNGTLASATVMYMDDVDANSASINSYMDSWDDSTHTALRGTVKITQKASAAIFAIYNVTGAVTSASTYSKVAVTYVTGAGSFTDADASTVVFTRTGNTGGGMANVVEDETPQLGGFLDPNDNFIGMQKGGDISSASPTVIDTDGDYFDVTGTTNFAAFTVVADRHFFIQFDGVLTMTHHATNLDLPGGANITTAAGDVAEFFSTGSNTVQCVNYTRASGKAVVPNDTAGKQTIWIPSLAMRPTDSNGCDSITSVETTAGRPDMHVLDFDNSADEAAQFQVCFPKSWNLGTITYQVWWTGLAATTGVAWGLQGVGVNDNETIDVAYGTIVIVTDDAQGAVEEVLKSDESSAVTIAGTPADDDICFFRIFRDVSDGNDDMAGDARLLGVKLFFTTDAENDD